MSAVSYLHKLREIELQRALEFFPVSGNILEIGAGTGWQAQALAGKGFEVQAIDLPESPYKEQRVWPVVDYDGRRIPFPHESFDVIFSSNVLEHVPHLDLLEIELHRVLRPGGRVVHILPTPAWRFWTNLTYYLQWPSRIPRILAPFRSPEFEGSSLRQKLQIALFRAFKALVPSAHGERGNAITELWYFSLAFWRQHFHQSGWTVLQTEKVKLFYSGYSILGSRLGLRMRRILSRPFGGACRLYVLGKPKAGG